MLFRIGLNNGERLAMVGCPATPWDARARARAMLAYGDQLVNVGQVSPLLCAGRTRFQRLSRPWRPEPRLRAPPNGFPGATPRDSQNWVRIRSSESAVASLPSG